MTARLFVMGLLTLQLLFHSFHYCIHVFACHARAINPAAFTQIISFHILNCRRCTINFWSTQSLSSEVIHSEASAVIQILAARYLCYPTTSLGHTTDRHTNMPLNRALNSRLGCPQSWGQPGAIHYFVRTQTGNSRVRWSTLAEGF